MIKLFEEAKELIIMYDYSISYALLMILLGHGIEAYHHFLPIIFPILDDIPNICQSKNISTPYINDGIIICNNKLTSIQLITILIDELKNE